ncbi:MAG: nucleotidyltransferase domain-containing protein [Prolixibacteraceae bacterium]
MFGIKPKSFQMILSALSEFREIEKAGIYGSRALGTYKPGSDIDLVLYGNKITEDTILKLKVKLEHELPIPYYFDLIHYQTISNLNMKQHIDEQSKVFYSPSTANQIFR